jgi:hypothetical protein
MLGLPLARTKELVVQQSDNELLIYDLRRNKAICLNETSALVWELCDGKHSVSEISDEMSKRLKVLVSEELVWLALDQFKKDRLLENDEMLDSNFVGLSRRALIKKVGFSTAIALPLITSIIAPSAAMAQSSCTPDNNPCPVVNPPNCCSNNCVNGICCTGSLGNNAPGATNCESVANNCSFTELAFCCSGNAMNNGQQTCPVGQVQCECIA